MRDDIAKQICERPRRNADPTKPRVHRRRLNRADEETVLKGESMARRRLYGYASKDFSDFLAPLKGFLAKSVGRPWNKVYAEMAALLPKDTTTGRHVWTHVDGYVEEHAVFENGRAYNPRGSGGYRLGGGKIPPKLRELGVGDLYVSEHGLLLRYRKKKPEKHSAAGPVTACQLVDPRKGYVKQGGVWWHVTFEIVLPGTPGHDPDVFGVHPRRSFETYGRRIKGDPLMLEGSTTEAVWYRRAISKRLMSKADVRQYILNP